jgi:hypothetical protein
MLSVIEFVGGVLESIMFIFRLIDGQTTPARARKQWWVMLLLVILTVGLVSEGVWMISPSGDEVPRPVAGFALAAVSLLFGTLLTMRWIQLAFLSGDEVDGKDPYADEN